jgi:ABC-2 type transport system permease protein
MSNITPLNAISIPFWIPFYSLFRREVFRFYKVIFQTIFTPLINSTLYLLIFGLSLGSAIDLGTHFSYLAFLIPGLVTMTVLKNCFDNCSSSVSISKFCGELEDLRVVPLSIGQIAWAMSLAGLVRGFILAVLTFGLGEFFYFFNEGKLLPITNPGIVLFFLGTGGLAFSNLGIAVAMRANSFDQVNSIASFILLPLIYLGGTFFPLSELHTFWQLISWGNPIFYLINGIRYGLLGESDVNVWVCGIISLTTLLTFHFFAVYFLREGSYKRW